MNTIRLLFNLSTHNWTLLNSSWNDQRRRSAGFIGKSKHNKAGKRIKSKHNRQRAKSTTTGHTDRQNQ